MMSQEDEPTRIALTPNGAVTFLGVVTSASLELVRTDRQLERLIDSLQAYWSLARERQPGQLELSADDERTVQVLIESLVAYLRGGFALPSDLS